MNQDIFQNETNTVSIWRYDPKRWLLQVEDSKVSTRVGTWDFAKRGPCDGVNYFMRQFWIPQRKMRWVCRELEIAGPQVSEKQKAANKKRAEILSKFKFTKQGKRD